MKQELDRVKNDLQTIQKAMGLTPSFGREWIQWMKRDTWLNLWWCLPGLILIGSALLPLDNTRRYGGLVPDQWVGLLVAGVMLGMLVAWGKVTRSGARPAGVVREYKRINHQGAWFGLAFLVQFVLYLLWANQHRLDAGAVMSGIWLLSSSSLFVLAVATRAWVFLGWVIPLLVFGLCQPLVHDSRWGGGWLGVMFIAAALLCSVIQVWQFRGMEKQHDTH